MMEKWLVNQNGGLELYISIDCAGLLRRCFADSIIRIIMFEETESEYVGKFQRLINDTKSSGEFAKLFSKK